MSRQKNVAAIYFWKQQHGNRVLEQNSGQRTMEPQQVDRSEQSLVALRRQRLRLQRFSFKIDVLTICWTAGNVFYNCTKKNTPRLLLCRLVTIRNVLLPLETRTFPCSFSTCFFVFLHSLIDDRAFPTVCHQLVPRSGWIPAREGTGRSDRGTDTFC